MKKRRLCVFLLLLCIGSLTVRVFATDSAAAGVIPESTQPLVISDPEGLRSMAAAPDGAYALGANINMDGVDWKPFAFSGTLDGRGYSIYNLELTVAGAEHFTSVDGNLKQYDTLGVGLFSTLEGATVSDLGIVNGRVTVLADQNCFCALLSGYINNSLVEKVKVSGTVDLTSSGIMVGVGGLCGFGTGDFRDCDADVTLIHRDRLFNMRCEQFTGGILATGYASCENCRVKIAGYTSCHGYVHDGGMVGMHYRYFDPTGITHTSTGNRVEGFISFFEDNWDRRAYCEPFCGENLYRTMILQDNEESFERREVNDYSTELVPHSCEGNDYSSLVTAPDCTHFGYTSYTCTACGYSYTDDYTEPHHGEGIWEISRNATMEESGEKLFKCSLCGAVLESAVIPPHVAGDWEITVESGFQTPGKRVRRCVDCGEILEEEELPPLVRTERIDLSEREVKLRFRGTVGLRATVFPENADDTTYSWSSSDSSVVTVNSEGTVFARSIGDAVVRCTANDGGAAAECTVHVRYTFGQQLIRIFLLGFLWYK